MNLYNLLIQICLQKHRCTCCCYVPKKKLITFRQSNSESGEIILVYRIVFLRFAMKGSRYLVKYISRIVYFRSKRFMQHNLNTSVSSQKNMHFWESLSIFFLILFLSVVKCEVKSVSTNQRNVLLILGIVISGINQYFIPIIKLWNTIV